MSQIWKFIILIFIILLLLSLIGLKEDLETKFKINPTYTPYSSTTLNCNDNSTNQTYPQVINFKPWYKPWSNGPNKMYCYVNDHLQRRCFWKCDSK